MTHGIVRKFLGQEKTPLERLLSTEGGKSALVTATDLETYDARLPDIDHFLNTFYELDIETVIEEKYDEEDFTSEERGSIIAYRHRAKNILDNLDQERALQNHADFESVEYSVPESLARDMEFAEEDLY